MARISLIKKLKFFRQFKKVVNENSKELENNFNIRIDNASRLYTVINVPEDLIGEAYALKKSDIDRISENYIRQYALDLSKYLDSKGLKELYSFYNSDKVSKYSYLLVFGFSLFKSDKYYKYLYYRIIPASVVALLTTLMFLIF
jgi:hypothetical protein